jgi:hypothetical protein
MMQEVRNTETWSQMPIKINQRRNLKITRALTNQKEYINAKISVGI